MSISTAIFADSSGERLPAGPCLNPPTTSSHMSRTEREPPDSKGLSPYAPNSLNSKPFDPFNPTNASKNFNPCQPFHPCQPFPSLQTFRNPFYSPPCQGKPVRLGRDVCCRPGQAAVRRCGLWLGRGGVFRKSCGKDLQFRV